MSNNGIENQAFSSGTGQQPMTIQPNWQNQGNDQRAAGDAPKLFAYNAPGYMESCGWACFGWLWGTEPGWSAYRFATRPPFKEKRPCLKEHCPRNFERIFLSLTDIKSILCQGSYIFLNL